jgi:replication-associated recombination protein RarA
MSQSEAQQHATQLRDAKFEPEEEPIKGIKIELDPLYSESLGFNSSASDSEFKTKSGTKESVDIGLDPMSSAILQRVRIRAKFRIEWLRKLWAEECNGPATRYINHDEVDAILAHRDNPHAEAFWIQQNPEFAALKGELRQLEQIIYADDSRITELCQIFSISQEDADLIQACYALQLDPSLSRLFAYLHDNPARAYVSTELVQRLFAYGYSSLRHTESPLRVWGLIQEQMVAPNEPLLLSLDPMVGDWLQGLSMLDPHLVEKATLCEVFPALENWPVEDTLTIVKRHINCDTHGRIRVIISGPEGSGRSSFAAVLAARLGMTLLAVNTDGLNAQGWEQVYRYAHRQAFLDRTALCWKGQSVIEFNWPWQITPFPVQFVVLTSSQSLAAQKGIIDHHIDIPPLSRVERQNLWKKYLPETLIWPKTSFDQLVNQHQITVGEIAAVAEKKATSFTDVQACLKAQSQHRLGDLAQHVECPFTWDDLVLPAYVNDMLQDMHFEVTERNVFWEDSKIRRLFPQGRGLMSLFTGPPGTGKTMSAQVIAAELGMDLFRIDLASVVSKYVGETSKNLEKIFSRAQHMDVVLLFDEADALLGKRTEIKDAHDRFANTDTNFLLQALEDYRGIAILSTNKKGNIDDAFLRRIRYVVDFPQPDGEQRVVLWQRLLGEIAGEDVLAALKADINRLASNIEMSGAQIKFSILGAMFSARRDRQTVNMQHLLRGVNRELMKQGRVISEHDKQRLSGV